jgi:hypothetical protein
MILETFDFSGFYEHVEQIFSKYFLTEQTQNLMEFVRILADANFRCYRANMIVIDLRQTDPEGHKFLTAQRIADMEWVARSVGEYRVASKARINQYISKVKSFSEIKPAENWMGDDIVYSIGEMMDRLSIETIKREDFTKNNRPAYMIQSSQELSNRVERYLKQKLVEIDSKGFYECVHEQRTYDLEGIVKDLAI